MIRNALVVGTIWAHFPVPRAPAGEAQRSGPPAEGSPGHDAEFSPKFEP